MVKARFASPPSPRSCFSGQRIVSAVTLVSFLFSVSGNAFAETPIGNSGGPTRGAGSIESHALYPGIVGYLKAAGYALDQTQTISHQEASGSSTIVGIRPMIAGGPASAEVPLKAMLITPDHGSQAAMLVTAIRSPHGVAIAIDVFSEDMPNHLVRWEMSEKDQERIQISEIDLLTGERDPIGSLRVGSEHKLSFSEAGPASILKKKKKSDGCFKDCMKSNLPSGFPLVAMLGLLACLVAGGLALIVTSGAAAPAVAAMIPPCLAAMGIAAALVPIAALSVCLVSCA